MKAFQIQAPGSATLIAVPALTPAPDGNIMLRVEMVGMCGTDLTTFRGGNAMVVFPRIPGHEVAATGVSGDELPADTAIAAATTPAGIIRPMGIQRDGAMTDFISVPPDRIYTADISLKNVPPDQAAAMLARRSAHPHKFTKIMIQFG